MLLVLSQYLRRRPSYGSTAAAPKWAAGWMGYYVVGVLRQFRIGWVQVLRRFLNLFEKIAGRSTASDFSSSIAVLAQSSESYGSTAADPKWAAGWMR